MKRVSAILAALAAGGLVVAGAWAFPIHGPGGVICRYHGHGQLAPMIVCKRGHYRVDITPNSFAVSNDDVAFLVRFSKSTRWSPGCTWTYTPRRVLWCGHIDQSQIFHGLYVGFARHWIVVYRPREGVHDKRVWSKHVR